MRFIAKSTRFHYVSGAECDSALNRGCCIQRAASRRFKAVTVLLGQMTFARQLALSSFHVLFSAKNLVHRFGHQSLLVPLLLGNWVTVLIVFVFRLNFCVYNFKSSYSFSSD